MTKRWAFMASLIACGLLLLAGCGQVHSSTQGSSRTTVTTAPPLPKGYGLVAADPSLTDRIVLSSTRIASGHSIDGVLLVVNHGSVPINLTKMCQPDFVVVLTSSNCLPQVAFAAMCSFHPFIILPGNNRLPFQVITTYYGCQNGGLPSPEPKCLSDGPPPLPRGNYDAVLIGDGLGLPEPRPIPVMLAAGTGRS